jgi:hypothetical protein
MSLQDFFFFFASHFVATGVPAHKLLEEKDRTLVFMHDRDDREEALWQREFKESLFDYAL